MKLNRIIITTKPVWNNPSIAVNPSFSVTNAYAVQWAYDLESPKLLRGGLSVDFADPEPSDSIAASSISPFDSVMPWAGMKRYNVINGEISYSQDDDGFSQKDYDTVVYIPTFYFRAEKNTSKKRWTWAISPTAQDGYTKHPGSGRYIGRYHTSGSADDMFSKSGTKPLGNLGQDDYRRCSHNKGDRWYMLDLATWSAVQMLYLVEYANFDSQTTLGTGCVGIADELMASGGTDEAIYHTLKISSGHNQYRWIEDPFGNGYDWLDGFVGSRSATYATASDTGYSSDTTGKTELGFALPPSGAIRGFGYSDDAPWAFIPDEASGADYTTYTCDHVTSSSTVYPAYIGGSYAVTDRYGLFFFCANVKAEYVSATMSSRLIYIP